MFAAAPGACANAADGEGSQLFPLANLATAVAHGLAELLSGSLHAVVLRCSSANANTAQCCC